MKASRKTYSKLALMLATSFGGGTVFSDCQGLVKDSVVGSIRQTLTSPDTVSALADAFLGINDTMEDLDD